MNGNESGTVEVMMAELIGRNGDVIFFAPATAPAPRSTGATLTAVDPQVPLCTSHCTHSALSVLEKPRQSHLIPKCPIAVGPYPYL